MSVIIRPGTTADIAQLATVERSAAQAFAILPDYNPSSRTVPPEVLHAMVQAENLWVAVTRADAPVGFVGCDNMTDCLYVHEVSVAFDHQKQGIGRRLMQTVLAVAAKRGYAAVGLTTRRDAAWNKPFYEALGFAETADQHRWPDLLAQYTTELAQGADPAVRCVMICVL